MADSITIPIDVSLPKYKAHVNKLFKNVKYMHKYLPGKKAAAKTFENGVVFSKFTLLATLLALAYKQGDVAFISKNPKEFLIECITVGASAMIPTAIFAFNRQKKKDRSSMSTTAKIKSYFPNSMLNGMFIAFLVFFIFHLIMEMSGFNGIEVEREKADDKEVQEWIDNNVKTKAIIGSIMLGGLIMSILALRVFDTSIFGKCGQFSQNLVGILELLSFGVINGIPAYMIAKNRGLTHEHSVRSGLIGFGMYSTLYVGLQLGGFWTHLFGLPESAI